MNIDVRKSANTNTPKRASDVFESIIVSLQERIVLPYGEHVELAMCKAADVVTGPAASRVSAMDDLLAFLLEEFHGVPSAIELHDFVYRLPVEARPIREAVFPVLLMVELLSNQRLKLDLSRCSKWDEFVKRYGIAVMLA